MVVFVPGGVPDRRCFLDIELGRARWNEGLLDPLMGLHPLLNVHPSSA